MENDQLLELGNVASRAAIKVIGVGGGGGNAVQSMLSDGINGVEFIVCNTDSKALQSNAVPRKIQIGPGLGAGGNPEQGESLALADIKKIEDIFEDKTHMVFITAGMGGGTGTGASPIIARVARSKGILTVGVVTIPFLFERGVRIDKALDGIEHLAKEVDALIVINNERLREIYPHLDILTAFRRADQTLSRAVGSVVEIINMVGHINLDFNDVDHVLRDGGVAVISSGYGHGEGRISKAVEEALLSPLLNNNDISRAQRLVLHITTSANPEEMMRMEESREIDEMMDRFPRTIDTKWGLSVEEGLGNRVKVTIVASGFHVYGTKAAEEANINEEEDEKHLHLRELYYGNTEGGKKKPTRPRIRSYIFSMDDLSNDGLIDAIDGSATRKRSLEDLKGLKELAQESAAPAPKDADEADGETSSVVIEF